MTAVPIAADAVEEFVALMTNAPSETRFYGPVEATLTELDRPTVAAPRRRIDCRELADLSSDANRIALCAYLQGFYGLAWTVTTRQIHTLAALPCGCARVYAVQPWVNLARLARAMERPATLEMAVLGLAAATERALEIDPRCLPLDASVGLIDGTIRSSSQHVGILETAKLKWLQHDYAACESLTRDAAPNSGVAMELAVRSLVELGRYDHAIALAATFAAKYSWLPAYAAVALLRGGARAEAVAVVSAVRETCPLPLLRLAFELARAGLSDDAALLALRSAEASLASGFEVPTMLAAAFLIASGRDVPPALRSAATAANSRHHPSALLFEFVVAQGAKDRRALQRVAQGARCVHKRALPPAMHRVLSDHRDANPGGPGALKRSRTLTADAAQGVLAAMTGHQ